MKLNAETAAVEFIIKVLTARSSIEYQRQYSIDTLTKAIDYAKTHSIIDKTLIKRATDAADSIPELEKFANDTIDLRTTLIYALKEALK